MAQRPDESIAVHQKMLTRFGEDEQYWAWEWIAYGYTQKGLPDSAFAIARRESLYTGYWHLWDWVYGAAGMPDSALRHVDDFEAAYQSGAFSAAIIGITYGYAGRRDEAFEWLDRAVDDHDGWLLFLNNGSGIGTCDSLITDPRWDELMDRIGFPEGNWKRRPIWQEQRLLNSE
jgi:tetratricopeptide (TPR) repeat protein